MLADHFFDDFYYVERIQCSTVAMFCLKEAFGLLGLTLDSGKSQAPAEVAHVLGGVFNTESLTMQRRLLAEPKPSRRANFALMVHHVLTNNLLPPSPAASILGKFSFLCSTLFAKVGRFCTGHVRHRQYSNIADHTLTDVLRLALKLMVHIVSTAPSRHWSMQGHQRPTILYTDASDVPSNQRASVRFGRRSHTARPGLSYTVLQLRPRGYLGCILEAANYLHGSVGVASVPNCFQDLASTADTPGTGPLYR